MVLTGGRRVRSQRPIAYLFDLSGLGTMVTCFRQLGKSQKRIVTRDWLESDVAVPAFPPTLLLVEENPVLVDLFELLGADNTDLVILSSQRAT